MQKLHVVCFRLILLMQGSYSGMNWISPVWIQTFLVYLGLKSGLYFCLKAQFEFRPFLVYLGLESGLYFCLKVWLFRSWCSTFDPY